MLTTVFGRVELLLGVLKIVVPIVFVAILIGWAAAARFAFRHRKALRHKILSLPVRTRRPQAGNTAPPF